MKTEGNSKDFQFYYYFVYINIENIALNFIHDCSVLANTSLQCN